MELLNSFLGKGVIAQIGKIVLLRLNDNNGNVNKVEEKYGNVLLFTNTQLLT